MHSSIAAWTAVEIRERFCRGDVSALEIADAFLANIERLDSRLGAFLLVRPEAVRDRARRLDERRAAGETFGPLAAVPVALKDNLCTRGIPTTCASRILKDFVPPYDATVVRRLLDADAVPIGKTNLDEFAMGSSTENSAVQVTRNPWDPSRIPGGSSGGSAVCVAADMAPIAVGSDTGGSIRQPAALCGVLGLKPTYGRVSRYGLVAFASSLDQIGPFARTAEDAALLLQVLAGHDPLDSTCARLPAPDFAAEAARPFEGTRIGLPREFFIEGMDGEVRALVEEAAHRLEAAGATLTGLTLPHNRIDVDGESLSSFAVAVYYIIATAEASSNLARYDGVRYGFRADEFRDMIDMYARSRGEGFGEEVKRRIVLGTYALSSGYYDAYYLKACKVRTIIRRDFDEAFKSVDLILAPTTPTAAFRVGEKTESPLEMYLSDVFTISANLAGNCAASVPCGFTGGGLPVGFQLIAPHWQEGRLLQAAHAWQQITDAHLRRPPIVGP
jgi:aspartyl-tRNA(Asn)/glutamyl-tRNA(Gln) amidotransferase subunit A